MALPWLRLYTDIQENHKVNLMPENMRWRYVMLLCSARKNDNSGRLTDEGLSFNWRISLDEVKETKRLFKSRGLISEDWMVLNWDERQPASDSSAARSRKSRDKLKSLQQTDTLQARSQHGVDKKRVEGIGAGAEEEDYRASY